MAEIIAEISNVHEGSYEYLEKLCNEVKNLGIINIKFQFIIPEEFGDKDSENYKEFKRLQITFEQYLHLLPQLDGMNVFFDIFSDLSFQQVLKLKKEYLFNIKGIKFHTTNSLDYSLITEAAKIYERIFLSVSGLTAIEISNLMDFLEQNNIKEKVVFSYGVQNYPTGLKDIKINKLIELKKIFNIKICLSDHLSGDLEIAKDIIIYADMLGYDYIEKHVTLDRNRRLDDDHAALNMNEINGVMRKIKETKTLFAANVLELNEKEKEYRNKAKQVIFTNTDIATGELIDKRKMVLKRQEKNYEENYLNLYDVIGKTAVHNIKKGVKVQYKDLKHSVYGLVIVRSASSRLVNKCYHLIGESESIRFLIKRLKKVSLLSKLIVCTTTDAEDVRIADIAREELLPVVQSSENVFQRISDTFIQQGKPDIFLRLTGDNVFVDFRHMDEALKNFIDGNYDYYKHDKVIDGCDFEIIKTDAFLSLDKYFMNIKEFSEYMTLFLKNSYIRKLPSMEYNTGIDFLKYRFTLDYPQDLDNIQNVFNHIRNIDFSYEQLCDCLKTTSIYNSFFPIDKSINIQANKKIKF